jgi:hypothetical protein
MRTNTGALRRASGSRDIVAPASEYAKVRDCLLALPPRDDVKETRGLMTKPEERKRSGCVAVPAPEGRALFSPVDVTQTTQGICYIGPTGEAQKWI